MTKAADLKKGSIIEIRVNFSPEKMDVPVQVSITRCTEHYLWFKYNSLQRIGRNTFDRTGYKIISI
jgi:hypothetical protein